MKKIYLLLIFILSFWVSLNVFADWWLSISPLRFEFEIAKWKTTQEKVRVTNSSNTTMTIYSSSEDFVSGDESWTPKFVSPLDNETWKYMLSSWITIEQWNITLAPNETQEVLFNINVPNNAEPGWHYAAIFFGPWAVWWAQVAVVQRLWVLILVNVSWEVKISWNVEWFETWKKDEKWTFTSNSKFDSLPITFKTTFENDWNTHLKPKWKITLRDDKWEILKNIWKETVSSPAWAYIWENMVDYLPINDTAWNVLPTSNRVFYNTWEWFWYSVLNDDWTRSVKFKTPEEYYKDKATETRKSTFLMPWQQVKTKNVTKKITAEFELYYEWKDKVKKDFNDKKIFEVIYPEEYIWINIYFLLILLILAWGWIYYYYAILPKQKAKKEELMRQKIIDEMNKKEIE